MLEIAGRSTGSKGRNFVKILLQCEGFFPPQHYDQRLNKSLQCKDKSSEEKMNEAYSMKCRYNILLLSELGFQLDQNYKSRHAGLILFGFTAAVCTQFDPLSKLAESKLIWVDYVVRWK